MIAYLDSSVVVRAYLPDEAGHEDAIRLMTDAQLAAITGTWTRIEVSGALVRAARSGRSAAVDERGLLAALDADLGQDGPVTVVSAPQEQVEAEALRLVRGYGLRAMDCWHLAVASLVMPALAEPSEELAFASRDRAQTELARQLGFRPI